MLNDKELAGLANRLQAPLIVQDVLCGQTALSDDVTYGLHHVLSEQQPDSALLSIALGARKIAVRYETCGAILAVLKMECARVIDDYTGMPPTYLSEDLQSLGELLETACALLQDKHPEAAALCRILTVQAGAQALVAETAAELMDADDLDMPEIPPACEAYTDNVVPFRGR